MRSRTPAAALLLVTLIATSCDRRSPVSAPALQPDPASARHAIGPTPGPGSGPPQATNPLARNKYATLDGRRLFNQFNCAGCHGTHAGGGMGPSLRDKAWIYGNEDADIFDSIASGRANGMPSFGSLLPPETIWQLVSYIHTLGTSEEPQPPT